MSGKNNAFHTTLKLIALNGRDVGNAIKEYLNPTKPENTNHTQAKMLGWITLLHQQTGHILKEYEVLPHNAMFQPMVETAFQAYIIEGREHKEI